MATAGYFSNHSQSRFPVSSTTSASSQALPHPLTPQSRLIPHPSKHFATSVLTAAADEKLRHKENPIMNGLAKSSSAVHPLRNTWIFWFRQQRTPGNKITNYEDGIKKISAFSSIESFWSLWTHLHPPSTLLPTTDYLIFHTGVRRPVWEDPLNLSGGKWIIRLKKGVADRVWEDLVLAIIGDQFHDCKADGLLQDDESNTGPAVGDVGDWPEICGCTISVRHSEDILSLWNRVDGDQKLQEKIQHTLRRVLHLSPSTVMEYKSNNDSMQSNLVAHSKYEQRIEP